MKVLCLSDVAPANTTSGARILYRHLQFLAPRVGVAVAHWEQGTIPAAAWHTLSQRKLSAIGMASRRRRHFEALDAICGLRISDAEVNRIVNIVRPDVLLTVAQGGLCHNARRVAANRGLPLAVFFHDWSPDWRLNPGWSRPLLESSFLRLARQSDLAWCISEQMRSAIGPHRNAQVLAPIPEPNSRNATEPETLGTDGVIVYSGVLNGYYESDIRRLAEAMPRKEFSQRFSFYGPNPHWSDESGRRILADGYRGFVPNLAPALAGASALLVIMPFAAEYRRFATLSFPSKMVEYCAAGRPIVVWGPSYASAVQWAATTGAAITVTESDPRALLTRFDVLRSNREEQVRLAKRARMQYDGNFRPEIIQRQFEDSLISLVSERSGTQAGRK